MSGPDDVSREKSQTPLDEGQASRARPCPVCGKPAKAEMKPFCSKRCADVDLHKWLGGVYALPAGDQDEPPDDA